MMATFHISAHFVLHLQLHCFKESRSCSYLQFFSHCLSRKFIKPSYILLMANSCSAQLCPVRNIELHSVLHLCGLYVLHSMQVQGYLASSYEFLPFLHHFVFKRGYQFLYWHVSCSAVFTCSTLVPVGIFRSCCLSSRCACQATCAVQTLLLLITVCIRQTESNCSTDCFQQKHINSARKKYLRGF